MSQDDRVETWSDCDTSDANSSSLNNSHSEEFSIQSTNPGEQGLKFKISCLRKTSNHETQNSPGTNLIEKSPSRDTAPSHQQDGIMEAQTSSDSKSLCAQEDQPKASDESFPVQPEVSHSGHGIPIERDKWNTKDISGVCSDQLEDDHDEKTLKTSSKICTANNRSSVVDAPEACFRMDALPNVSPDSGIVSFEDSPFGNESPNSITGMEHIHEPHNTLTVPKDLQHSSNKNVNSVAMGKYDSNEASVSKEAQESAVVSYVGSKSCTQDSVPIESPVKEADPLVSDSKEEREKQEAGNAPSVEKLTNFATTNEDHFTSVEPHSLIPPKAKHELPGAVTIRDDIGSVSVSLDTQDLPKQSDFADSKVILSSPDKISQPAWRKKKGKKQRRKKTLLLNHKKSTLYNIESRSSLPKGNHRTEPSDCPETVSTSHDSTESVKEPLAPCTSLKLVGKKRSPGRPKGSLNRKAEDHIQKGTFRRPYTKMSVPLQKGPVCETALKSTVDPSPPTSSIEKRPRGRPRKCPLIPENGQPPQLGKAKIIRKKKPRKRLFTHMKKTTVSKQVPSRKESKAKNQKSAHANLAAESNLQTSTGNLEPEPDESSLPPPYDLNLNPQLKSNLKKNKDIQNNNTAKEEIVEKTAKEENVEKSIFQDNDLDALLQSVNRSINKQFIADEENNEMISSLSFDNPFKSVQTPSFPQIVPSNEGCSATKTIRPKYKKPKLHVMMRKTKRRKKKKKLEPSRTSAFGVSSPEKRLSFFSSCVQPSKILASSRLNVFQSGTGVENSQTTTPSESEFLDGPDRRLKRKRRLLNFKSKHKNIIDPVFAAELDMMVSGLHDMTISEDSNDNFIKVRPGEMPLPTIFRVIKIDVSKKTKDRVFALEPMCVDSAKAMKSRKEQLNTEIVGMAVKTSGKSGRKKSSSDQSTDSKDQQPLSDTSDQWLPPKKRHRMVNIDGSVSLQSSLFPDLSEAAVPLGKDSHYPGDKRKGRRPKRTAGAEHSKQGGMTSKSVDQQLTIDTSSCSGPCSTVGGQTPSPCHSRLSTRSSTIPSLSSLSPTGSSNFRSRHALKNALLACPIHSLTLTSQDDCSACAECQLIRQSVAASPSNSRANPPSLQRSLSTQLSVEPFCSSELVDSSSESSPCFRSTWAKETVNRRTPRKRCQSSTFSAEDSDPSPPRLEKNCAPVFPSPAFDADCSIPPKISPAKGPLSPQTRSTYRRPQLEKSKLTSPSRSLRPSSCRSAGTVKSEFMCNMPDKPSQSSSSSQSVISDPNDSDWQPLPLKFCTKRKLVEEIQAALHSDSSDSDSSVDNEEEDEEVPYPSISTQGSSSVQPPRKRYQRVGLFSDFYKDDEPRRRCESMVRCRDKLAYIRDDHEYGLMPMPVHIGYFYMRQVQHFKLPYDIWWQDVHQQLPKKLEPKIKFRTIKSNVYSDSKVSSRKVEHPMCNCKPSPSVGKGCLDDCLNRMIYTECSPTNCPLLVDCANQRIQKHEWAPGIEKFLTADRGYGVRVTKPVKSGQFLLEYLGEVISETEFRRRMMEEYSEECHHYALHLDSGTIIDGYRMGNIGRYVNHSCQPNCEMQKWNVNGLYRMVLFALRDIQPFEELVYDYNFDAFNQETQQECRCGSAECRGVIGGKAQRTNGQNRIEKADDSKDKRKSRLMNKKTKEKKQSAEAMPVQPPTKPMTHKERCYARKHRTFLVRNVDKVRNQRHPGQVFPLPKEEIVAPGKINCVTSDVLLANLSDSSVKTRLAALDKDNPEIMRRHRLAQLFDKMLTELLSLKDEEGSCMVTPLMALPSRKKQFQYYQVVKNPIDMSMIKQRVKTGMYHHLSSFNADVMLLFTNVELYCGHKSELGQVILKLRRIFNCVKQEMASQLDEEMGPGTTKMFMDLDLEKLEQAAIKNVKEPEEDIIRCICGVTRDEGLMLQCEKCMKWQHCDCVRASGEEEHYLCDRCEPRYYDPEIPLAPNGSDAMPDCTHFMTLVKDDVQYAVGDCVYVMRDCKRTASGTPLRSSHRLMATTNPDSLDIFRIDKLWKDPKGERFASGTPYLRPQETFHEPTRKFFHNELFRTPNYEIIPLDLVMGKCVVMDPNNFSKGRPKAVKEQDIYICEYRVDKTAHLFHKIKDFWYPINTSKFCFDWFDTKLTLKRTFTPHEVPEEYIRKAERNAEAVNARKTEPTELPEKKHDVKKSSKHQILNGKVKVDESLKHDIKLKAEVKVNVKKGGLLKKELKQETAVEKPDMAKLMELKRQEKRHRLDRFLTRLLQNIPGKQKIDLSYLLDGGRRIRKKLVK